MGWKADYRMIHGRQVRIHPGKVKQYVSEVTRWRLMRDGLTAVLESVPRTEKRVYVTLAEVMAYCDYRMECCVGDAETHTRGLFSE